MVRASLLGAIDFSQADPSDSLWWKRTYWILNELAATQHREVITRQHQHWLGLLANQKVVEDTEILSDILLHANEALSSLMTSYWPWQKAAAAVETTQSRDALLDAYYAEYGRPGEERYENMLAEVTADLARKARTNGTNQPV